MDFPNINFATLKDELIREEGDKRYPYDDSTGKYIHLDTGGNVTIGIGRNLGARPLSSEVVEMMFAEDAMEAIAELKIIFKRFDNFTQGRAHALINMMFNLGGDKFRGFIHMIEAVEISDWVGAARGVKSSLFYKERPNRAERIMENLVSG